ncbi:MAG TPA: hypothetical protein VFL80_02825, partial [Thermoanaerobaculia bacterium]|nr:hypothetical protein [Thermoanaerobaculia bacterium]
NAEVSARDNWAVALVTLGEGYHSFHHRFPADFRNGIRWYQWDPAKWFIRAMRVVGLAWDLRETPPPQIEHARMRAALDEVEPRLVSASGRAADEIRAKVNAALENLEKAFHHWREHVEARAAGVKSRWRAARKQSRQHVLRSRREWKSAVRMLQRLPDAA